MVVVLLEDSVVLGDVLKTTTDPSFKEISEVHLELELEFGLELT